MYDIYHNARSDKWRFSLGRSGSRSLLVIGLNPSTATQEKSDTTVAKVDRVAKRHGFDGFVMLNLYPVRATNFNELPINVDAEAYFNNLNCIEDTVTKYLPRVIWAAWGESILARSYFLTAAQELFDRLGKHDLVWQHFGPITASGHPRHPSRLSYAWSFSKLDTKAYVQLLRDKTRDQWLPNRSTRTHSNGDSL